MSWLCVCRWISDSLSVDVGSGGYSSLLYGAGRGSEDEVGQYRGMDGHQPVSGWTGWALAASSPRTRRTHAIKWCFCVSLLRHGQCRDLGVLVSLLQHHQCLELLVSLPFISGEFRWKCLLNIVQFKRSRKRWCCVFVQSVLPWSECPVNSNRSGYVEECEVASSTQYFFYRETLNVSSSIDENGGVHMGLALCLLLAWVIVFLFIVRGVKSTGMVISNATFNLIQNWCSDFSLSKWTNPIVCWIQSMFINIFPSEKNTKIV